MQDERDPKGLIRESFRIEGISEPECRSIFLDWAISIPTTAEPKAYLKSLLQEYSAAHSGHPMLSVLKEALEPPKRTGRRGGARGRRV